MQVLDHRGTLHGTVDATEGDQLRVIKRGTREMTQAEFDTDEGCADEASPEQMLLDSERDRKLWSALRQLSERCHTLLRVMAYSPDAGYPEISRLLGLPIGSIGPTRARCLAHLRRRLEHVGYHATEGPGPVR